MLTTHELEFLGSLGFCPDTNGNLPPEEAFAFAAVSERNVDLVQRIQTGLADGVHGLMENSSSMAW